MYQFFYNAFITIFRWVIAVLGLFSEKARLSIDGRRKVLQEVHDFREQHHGQVLWVHAASLGEFEQGRPIIERWNISYPNYGIVCTFFSPSGYEVRKAYPNADLVTYLPLDTPRNARNFLDCLKPDIALFIKYDFWFNLLNESVKRKVKVIYISSLFRKDQVYFHRGSRLFLPLFRKIDHFFVQNEQSKDLLHAHGVTSVTVAGDTRLDRVLAIKNTPFENAMIETFCDAHPVIVFGSTWYSDIEFLKSSFSKLVGPFRLIFAPHHIDENSIDQIRTLHPKGTVLLSENAINEDTQILIIDEVGSLAKIYRYAKYVYIGGALHEGLHNTLEPAVYGVPIFFARHPGNNKFVEAIALEVAGGAFSLERPEVMLDQINRMEKDQAAYVTASQASASYVKEQAGASDLIFNYLSEKV